MPRLVHERVIQPLAELLPVSHDNFSLDFKVKRFLRGAAYRPEIRDQVWVGSFTPQEQRRVLADASQSDDYEDILAAEKLCPSHDTMERLTYLYCKFCHPAPPAQYTLVQGPAPTRTGVRCVQHFPFLGFLPAPIDGWSYITELYEARYGVPKFGQAIWIRICQHIDGWIDVPKVLRARVPAPDA